MDAFDLLLKAAPPFPPKKDKDKDKDKGASASGGEDCPTDDKDGDGTPNSLDENPDSPGGDDAKAGPPGDEGGEGELTPEEQAALDGEGEELPPEEDGFGGEGDEFGEPGMDEGAQGEMSDIISQLAAAEQKFYATKGQMGGGHHNTDAALEDMHKLVRKLAKKVAGNHGLNKDGSLPEPEPGAEGMPEEMAMSLSPGLRGYVEQQAAAFQKAAHSKGGRFRVSFGPAQMDPPSASARRPHATFGPAVMDPPSSTRSRPPQQGRPREQTEAIQGKMGQAVPQVYAQMGADHLEGPVGGAGLSAKMSHPSPDGISMANYVGDPNGGAMLNWDSIMMGRMGTRPAKAGADGYPSQIIEQDGSVVTTGQGSVPGAAGISGQNPYSGSDAAQGPPTGIHMPGAAPLSPPAGKMGFAPASEGSGSWIDWSAPSDPRGGMPFAGQINTMMIGRQGPQQAPLSPPQPGRAPMAGKATLLAEQQQAPQRPRAPQGPSLAPRPPGSSRMPPRIPQQPSQRPQRPMTGKRTAGYVPGTSSSRQGNVTITRVPTRAAQRSRAAAEAKVNPRAGRSLSSPTAARMTGKTGHRYSADQQGSTVTLKDSRTGRTRVLRNVPPNGVSRVRARRPTQDAARDISGQMSAFASPVPSAPGVPVYRTAPMAAGMGAEHQSQGMSGFDYAMIGRMQRLEAGYAPLERSLPEEARPLTKADISFEFLLDMSDDFLAKAEEVLAILED